MPLYMGQYSYTAQAWNAMARNPENRDDAIMKLSQALGGKMVANYRAMSEYFDGFAILDLPDDRAAEAFLVAAQSAGHMKDARMIKLLTAEEAVDAMKQARNITYRGPAGAAG